MFYILPSASPGVKLFFFIIAYSFRLYPTFSSKKKRRITLTAIRLFYSHSVNIYKIISVILDL